QDCSKPAHLAADDPRPVVDHQPRHELGAGAPLHPCLLLVDRETLLRDDQPHLGHQVADPLQHFLAAGEGQVVSVARIGAAERPRQPIKATVEPARDLVGEGWTGAGALRQTARPDGDKAALAADPLLAARTGGAEQAEDGRHRGRVAEALEDAADAAKADAREEPGQVHVDDDGLAGVWRRIGDGAAARMEAVTGVLDGELVEDVLQNPALGTAHQVQRRVQGALAAALLRDREADIVNPRGHGRVVGEPAQLRDGHSDSLGQLRGGREHGQSRGGRLLDFAGAVLRPGRKAVAEEGDVDVLARVLLLSLAALGLSILLPVSALFFADTDLRLSRRALPALHVRAQSAWRAGGTWDTSPKRQ